MTGDNSTAMKQLRAYDRLLCAIIEGKPKNIIDALLFEYVACDNRYYRHNDKLEEYSNNILKLAEIDSKKYFSHRQGGRSVIVLKDSPLGKKLSKGAFNPSDEAV